MAISKEKERLLLENAQLQDLIQQVSFIAKSCKHICKIFTVINTPHRAGVLVFELQYISGTQLTQDTLSEDNPLFVVNGRWGLLICINNIRNEYAYIHRANLNFDPPVRKIKPVIQDAIQIQNTAARQTAW